MAEHSGFERIGDDTRLTVRATIASLLIRHGDEGQAAVTLGALAGAVDCFVCASIAGTPRDQLKEALRGVISDFVDQAKDQLTAGLQ